MERKQSFGDLAAKLSAKKRVYALSLMLLLRGTKTKSCPCSVWSGPARIFNDKQKYPNDFISIWSWVLIHSLVSLMFSYQPSSRESVIFSPKWINAVDRGAECLLLLWGVGGLFSLVFKQVNISTAVLPHSTRGRNMWGVAWYCRKLCGLQAQTFTSEDTKPQLISGSLDECRGQPCLEKVLILLF